jgi:hypothetical protein
MCVRACVCVCVSVCVCASGLSVTAAGTQQRGPPADATPGGCRAQSNRVGCGPWAPAGCQAACPAHHCCTTHSACSGWVRPCLPRCRRPRCAVPTRRATRSRVGAERHAVGVACAGTAGRRGFAAPPACARPHWDAHRDPGGLVAAVQRRGRQEARAAAAVPPTASRPMTEC